MLKSLFQEVLILVNSSESSINAVRYGILLSKIYKCHLRAVYVVDTATIKQLTMSRIFIHEEGLEFEENLLNDGKRYLQYVQELGKTKGVEIDVELKKGDVGSEIIKSADDNNIDLILLGGYERNLSDPRDILSTSYKKILVSAPCSVLVVKEKMVEQLYRMV